MQEHQHAQYPDQVSSTIHDLSRSSYEALRPLLTPDEFRIALGEAIGRNSIYELIRSGRIKSIKVGRKILIPRNEVIDFPVREATRAAS